MARSHTSKEIALPRLVTSVTEDYYSKKGGKEFLETFRRYWPKSVELIIYYEGDVLRDDEENIKWHWYEEVEDWGIWERRLKHWPFKCGVQGSLYNVQADATHWRKAFIENHAVNRFGGKVFWLDSDVVTFDHVPETFLDECLPDDKMCCYLGRKSFYSETGFIGWNGNHELTKHFFKLYLEFFKSGAIFACQRWHDCEGFDRVKEIINRPDLFLNLTENNPYEDMHPFINSVCGKYMDHRKGPSRKNEGSFKTDIVTERPEPYWNQVREIGPNALGEMP